jgi:hypothetical protein
VEHACTRYVHPVGGETLYVIITLLMLLRQLVDDEQTALNIFKAERELSRSALEAVEPMEGYILDVSSKSCYRAVI